MEEINSIFDIIYDKFTVKNKIRLIELFAGYGSQALALKYLGADFEHYKICEWALPSIIAYADLHCEELENYGIDVSKTYTKEMIATNLHKLGISLDYNKPASLNQLKRLNEEKLRLCFNSIFWSNNLVDISRVKGTQINVVERERFTYIMTYSFPCQDLSLAGKGAGMEKGSGTRSGLLWEVERILNELHQLDELPQILLMENVTQIHNENNNADFKNWQLKLEELGYQSYWNDMSAVDFGIPQTRNRTFMISILGDYNYNFPKKIPLKLRLKDLLESNVDEKYYLSEKMIDYISATGTENFKNADSKINKQIARPLTTEQNKRAGTTNYISENTPEEFDLSSLKIKNATKKGYLEAQEGDGIDISTRMETHRGTVQKDKAQTLTCMGGENVGVVVALKRGYSVEVKEEKNDADNVDYLGSYSKCNYGQTSVVGKNGLAPTVTENHGQVTAILERDNKNEI